MHEYSIVQSLLDSCEENAKVNNATKVTKVVVKIGVMSGVEPDLLQTAFDTFKEETICHDAKFIINIQKVKIECNECQTTSELEKNEYCCPKCQSTNIKILDGEEMYLMQLELE
jgi:hydrogenase nickel incorporation protein HypA/HybF